LLLEYVYIPGYIDRISLSRIFPLLFALSRGGWDMPMNAEKVTQLERQWREAQDQLLREQGRMYEIIRRKISADEWQRIMDSLEDREERILFGLEAPDEPRRRGSGAARPGKSGGDLRCPICGKEGLTKRGLALHMARIHKGERDREAEVAA
jgi:hypothetical protein